MTEPSGSRVQTAEPRSFFARSKLRLVEPAQPPIEVVSPPEKSAASVGASFLDEVVQELIENSLAPETRRSYKAHQDDWHRWCTTNKRTPLPAKPMDVVEHLVGYAIQFNPETEQALRDEEGNFVPKVAVVSVNVRRAAIDKLHDEAGHERPGTSPEVAKLLKGLRRQFTVRPVHGKAPLMLADLRKMLRHLNGETYIDVRDRVVGLLKARHDLTPGQVCRLGWAAIELGVGEAYLSIPGTTKGAPRAKTLIKCSARPSTCLPCQLALLRELAPDSEHLCLRDDRQPMTRQGVDLLIKRLGREVGGWSRPQRQVLDALARMTNVSAGSLEPKRLRDAAILTTGWFSALRRSNIAQLNWRDLNWQADGIEVLVRRSKTDQEGHGFTNWLPEAGGDDIACPVRALTAWRDHVAGVIGGDPRELIPTMPVFMTLDRHGTFQMHGDRYRRIDGKDVNLIVQDLAIRVGLTVEPCDGARNPYGGHSLRVGFVTEALLDGKLTIAEVQAVTRHKDIDVLIQYNRALKMKRDNPVRRLFSPAVQAPVEAE